MPNFRFPSLLIAFTIFVVLFSLDQSLAQEAEYGPSGTSTGSISAGSGPDELSVQTRFQASNFQNRTLGMSGVNYTLGLSLASAGGFQLYADVPFLWGETRGAPVQELGNPKFGLDFSFLQAGDFDFWAETSATVTQPSGRLAARYDTYRAGAELRYRRARYFGTMGAGHRFRVNEQDKQVDIGNVSDFDLTAGFSLRRQWAVLGLLEWYRSEGVIARNMVYARPAEWAGVSPAVRYRGAGGFEVLTAVTFPILQSREEEEMEVAFWDSSFPRVSQVSLRTQVGVWF